MVEKKRLPRSGFQARGYTTKQTPYFFLKIKKNESRSVRIGIVVPKGVNASAVKRNFWKRQGRETLKKILHEGTDVIITLRAPVNSLTKKQFQEKVTESLR